MPVTKEFKTYEEQLKILERRKLKFKNKKKSFEILRKYNYFDVVNGFESILLRSWRKGIHHCEYLYFFINRANNITLNPNQ